MTNPTSSRVLLSGNEAIARGAWEAGVTVATGYPGTPSTEILEAAKAYKTDMYCEWSPNEKVALEVAAGASLAGARAIVTMKHVGLNVAADPLMTLSYIGTVGGLALCVADDPGMHSSQNEQDTRHYARFAKIPILEPSDSQEAKDFLALAIEISEKHSTPVILRSTTRVSHSSGVVTLGTRAALVPGAGFQKNPQRFVPIPLYASAHARARGGTHPRPFQQRQARRLPTGSNGATGGSASSQKGSRTSTYGSSSPRRRSSRSAGSGHFRMQLLREFAAGVKTPARCGRAG